jgi:hypothetical protein
MKLTLYFTLQNFVENKYVKPVFDFLFPHIFIHKHGEVWYENMTLIHDGCLGDVESDSGYNAIRCSNSASWHPFGYFPQYKKTADKVLKKQLKRFRTFQI